VIPGLRPQMKMKERGRRKSKYKRDVMLLPTIIVLV